MSGPDPRGGPSLHGAALGRGLAKLADAGFIVGDKAPARCKSCAFRLGSMPNQCAGTLSDALSSLTGQAGAFMCHHGLDAGGEPTKPCAGYEAARRAPFALFRRALEDALETMPTDGDEDPVREAYVAWLETVDPENRLDDYQRAALYAQEGTTP